MGSRYYKISALGVLACTLWIAFVHHTPLSMNGKVILAVTGITAVALYRAVEKVDREERERKERERR